MSRLTLTLCRLLRAAVLALVALTAPAVLRAQTMPTPKVFYACYVPSSGSVYRVKETGLKQECSKSTHVQFSWTDGTSTPGFSSIKMVRSEFVSVPAGETQYAAAVCPDGYKVISGSYVPAGGAGGVGHWMLVDNFPTAAGDAWVVFLRNTDPNVELLIGATATCLK